MKPNEKQLKRISIRNIYKQRKIEKENINKKIRRYNDEEFNNEFNIIKNKANTKIEDLNYLLFHNNLNSSFLEYYFNILYKTDKSRFTNEILLIK